MLGGSSGRVRRSTAMAGKFAARVSPYRSRCVPKSGGRVKGPTHQNMGTRRDARWASVVAMALSKASGAKRVRKTPLEQGF